VTYTDPPLAQVGITEEEVRATGRDLLIAMYTVACAIEKSETFGLMKAIVDAQTERILGATIFGGRRRRGFIRRRADSDAF